MEAILSCYAQKGLWTMNEVLVVDQGSLLAVQPYFDFMRPAQA